MPTYNEITDVDEYSTPMPGPLPSNDEIKKENNITNKEKLETALAIAKQNLSATTFG